MHYLKKYKPQLLVLIFLGYAPFLGESFRFYFLPISGFIIFAFLFTLFNLREFKQFLLERNSPQFWWILIILYCLVVTLWNWGQHPSYATYLDLGSCFAMLFGLFFGSYLSIRITFEQLLLIFRMILALLFLKTLYIMVYQVIIPADGTGFFVGGGQGGFSVFPRIIFRGENPFLISIFLLEAGSFALNKHKPFQILVAAVSLLATGALIALTGWRSIYFALVPSILLLLIFCAIKKRALNKVIWIGLLFTLFFASITWFNGRDALTIQSMSAWTQTAGMEKINTSNIPLLNNDILLQITRNQFPLLNSLSVALKIGEYLQIIHLVGDRYLTGLGMGATYYSPGPAAIGNYVHSQPFWLYLKGGLILLILFYSFIVWVLVKKYQAWKADPQNQSILVSALILIALCVMDALTNQYPTLAGSFYLGFWTIFSQTLAQGSVKKGG